MRELVSEHPAQRGLVASLGDNVSDKVTDKARDKGKRGLLKSVGNAHRPDLSLRTPRSGAFVVSFVDKVTDKARDKALRSLKNQSNAHRPD